MIKIKHLCKFTPYDSPDINYWVESEDHKIRQIPKYWFDKLVIRFVLESLAGGLEIYRKWYKVNF